MAQKWYDSEVIEIGDAAPNVKRFWLRVVPEEGETFSFQAGQFVTLDLPISEKRLQRWRSYSIANAPDDSHVIELCIVRLDGGLGTTYLFEEVKKGSHIRLKAPAGVFTLPAELDRDLVFVCTGTGIAPFRSMLWDIYNRQVPHQGLHLIFGTRQAEGILYQDELEQLQALLPGFRYSVALSREPDLEAAQFGFEVRAGYVHQFYEQAYATPRPDVRFYLCGWRNMIDDAVARLDTGLGYAPAQVVYELYG